MALLDAQTRTRLLNAARAAIERELFGAREPEPDQPWPPMEPSGAFVTLRKRGRLRGCIGTFVPQGDLVATVRSMAAAAANDPRFVGLPISAAEMKDISIEISVLSPLRRIDDPLDFELGRHGIYVKRGGHVGCFLPDVATEEGWDKETFLSECCGHKAGMKAQAWKQPGTEVHVFTVEKFGD